MQKTRYLWIGDHQNTWVRRTKGYADMDHPPPHDLTHAIPPKPKRWITRTLAWMHAHPFASTGVALFVIPAFLFLLAMGSTLRVPSFFPLRNIPPQLSDFTPPYTCPATNAPRSCTTPIKVAVECVDRRSLHPSSVSRPLTKTETLNEKKACEFLPLWLDKDPRITIVERGKEDLALTYRLSPFERKFSGAQIFVKETNFLVTKSFNDQFDKASYFVEQSLLKLGKRGYLP